MGSLIKIGGTYYGKYKELDGSIVRKTTKQRHPQKAANILAEWERRVAQGLWGQVDDEEKRAAVEARERREIGKDLTLHALCTKFMAEYRRPKIKDMKRYWWTYGAYIRHGIQDAPMSRMKAAAVRKADVEKWRDEFLKGRYTPATANMVLRVLNMIYNWAIDHELLDMRSPCRGVEHAPNTARAAMFDLDQMQRLLRQEADPMLSTMIQTVTYAGLRHGELAGLRWQDIDAKAKTPHIMVQRSYRTTPKGGKPRAVPLHPVLAAVLEAWRPQCPAGDEGLVFPTSAGHMARTDEMFGLPDLLQAADCPLPLESGRKGKEPHCRAWHALRHSFASRCHACGIPRDVISELLGHSAGGPAVTGTYLHDTPERLQRVADELGRLWYLPAIEKPADAPPAQPEALAAPLADVIDFQAARALRAARRAG